MILDNKKTAYFILIAVFFVGLDRFFKILAVRNVYSNPKNLWPGFLQFNFSANYNIAFSIPVGGKILIFFIILIIISLICYLVYLFKNKKKLPASFVFTIILGASSNLFDRINYGFVIDYLDMKYFTVFNMADAMIVLGVMALIYFYYLEEKNNKIIN